MASSRFLLRWLVTVAMVAVAAGVVGGVVGGFVAVRLAPTATPLPLATVSLPDSVLADDAAFVAMVQRVGPAVVTVKATTTDDGRRSTSFGSGFVIDGRGFIVTNEHVVRGARVLSVVFADGQSRPASLVGTDYPFSDVAVLKVQETVPAVAAWGDSEALRVGQRVLAIGTALGRYENTVTQGIVSGLERRWSTDSLVLDSLIQTDAAVNRGHSGGPLVNLSGQVIGVNTSVVRRDDDNEVVEGIGFALPSHQVADVAAQLVEHGKVRRPFLGISHRDVTPEMARLQGLPASYGALVTSVGATSPAGRAGLKAGDLVVGLGGRDIGEEFPFLNVLKAQQPGEEIELRYFRDDEARTMRLVLAER